MNDQKEIEDFASRLAGAIKVSCGADIPNHAMQVALKASLDYERLEITPIDKWQDISTHKDDALQERLKDKPEPCIACNGSGYYDHDGSPPCGLD